MKIKLSYLLFLTAFLSFAQNKFEPGYYIDNSGIKTECLIKNYDWKNNPTSIETKNTSDDKTITKTIEEIQEFGIINKSKFVKATVKVDESSPNLITLTNSPSPKFIEKTVLLKILVEGKSNLYYFESEDYDRFFYTVNNKIEQLVYKQYNNSEGNISTNDAFKQQLFVNFKCNNDQKSIIALKYNNNDLVDYFIKTNNCISGNTETKAISEKRKFETNFKVNFLLNSINSTIIIPNGNISGNYETDKRNAVSFGFEVEVLLPYNNKNWSFIFDPSYIQNKESLKIYKPQFINPDETLFNDIFTLRLPLGLRRYFKMNKISSLFANASFSINANKANIHTYNPFNNTTIVIADEMYLSSNFALGAGYQYKKYSAEIKFNTKTPYYSVLVSDKEHKYSLNQISLKLGYKLF
ncbi:hypothetical protein [Flavobacterium terrigena]|uniref:Outer membrane protein beta-barrel domain-containing protein n=1 Tax=Flavobacterium terrigena TaxID=402734 RepID=A0A1H6QE72_9FLAO|nr:hypothetical protein [Flavobacterium terrigena]SEI38527.1 hypothetical protein SAMN05660918_0254 [Flavobacterium terrigena]